MSTATAHALPACARDGLQERTGRRKRRRVRLRPHPRKISNLVPWTAVFLLAGGPTHAQPTVRVRTATRLALRVAHETTPAHIEGALSDDLGAGIEGQEVRIQVLACGTNSMPHAELRGTDTNGFFRVDIDETVTACAATATYDGDDYHDRSEARLDIDARRASVDLRIALTERPTVRLTAGDIEIETRARSAAGAVDLTVVLHDETNRELARGTTGRDGAWRIALPRSALGAPGVGRLIAVTPASAQHDAARAEEAITRTLATRVQLTATAFAGEPPALDVRGSLRGDIGPKSWLAGKAVSLFADSSHIATLITDSRGDFRKRIALANSPAKPATVVVHARFEPDAPWIEASRSIATRVQLPPPLSPSPLWLAAPVFASIALVSWLAWRARTHRRAAGSSRPITSPWLPSRAIRRRGGALTHHIEGTVTDTATDLPVPTAHIRVQRSDGTAFELPVACDGSFRSPVLPAGRHDLEAAAEGYSPLTMAIALPRSSETSGVSVRLMSLRALALDAYHSVAQRVFASTQLARLATPRDTLLRAEHIAFHRTDTLERLVLLTRQVEHAAYACAAPNCADVSAIASAAQEIASATDAQVASPNGGSRSNRASFPHPR